MLFPPVVPRAGITLVHPAHQRLPGAIALVVRLAQSNEQPLRLKPVLEVLVDRHLDGPGQPGQRSADDAGVASEQAGDSDALATRAFDPGVGVKRLDVLPVPTAATRLFQARPPQPEEVVVHPVYSAHGTRVRAVVTAGES